MSNETPASSIGEPSSDWLTRHNKIDCKQVALSEPELKAMSSKQIPPLTLTRRQALRACAGLAAGGLASKLIPERAAAGELDPNIERAIDRGLNWVAQSQSKLGHWTAQGYPTAMTALGGTALIAAGSTTTQGSAGRTPLPIAGSTGRERPPTAMGWTWMATRTGDCR